MTTWRVSWTSSAPGAPDLQGARDEVLRAGLGRLENAEQARPRGPYTRAVSLGKARLPDVDDVSEALAITEGDDYR